MQHQPAKDEYNQYSDDSVDEIQKHQFLASNRKEKERKEMQKLSQGPYRHSNHQKNRDYYQSSTSGHSGNIQEHELDELSHQRRQFETQVSSRPKKVNQIELYKLTKKNRESKLAQRHSATKAGLKSVNDSSRFS